MFWPENKVAAAPQSLALYKAGQEYKGLNFYSVEELRQRLPISSRVSPFATRLVRDHHFVILSQIMIALKLLIRLAFQ